jgi:hypothetical protein
MAQATERQAAEAIVALRQMIEAAENSNQNGENAVVLAASAARLNTDRAVLLEAAQAFILDLEYVIADADKQLDLRVHETNFRAAIALCIAALKARITS